jgi:hypothetical protein
MKYLILILTLLISVPAFGQSGNIQLQFGAAVNSISAATATNIANGVYSNNPSGYQTAAQVQSVTNGLTGSTNNFYGSFSGNGQNLTNLNGFYLPLTTNQIL